ncbi:MAG: beta-galactosidase [Treponema sp.]|nr:beta-galactosidase [Treponema sp.]
MKYNPFAAILSAVLLVFSACAPSSRLVYERSIAIPADYAGIVHAGRTGTQEEFDYLHYLGASWVLNSFYWDRIEPRQGEWNFSSYDTFVDSNRAEGIKVLGVLAYDVGWIHEDGRGHDYVPPDRVADFARFVRNTVEHFRGRVDAWCIWNEPNTARFWKGTDDEFVELTRHVADAVREVDTEVVLLGGAFNRNVLGLPEKFIRKLFESGAMAKVDGIAFHPYELNPTRSAALYDKFRRIVDDYGFGDKIWLTEAGYPTGGRYPTRIQENRFPEYVVKTFVLLAARGSDKLLWYQLFDPVERSSGNSEDFFGLVRSDQDYTSKGAEAFRLCAQYLPGTNCVVQESGRDGIPGSVRMFWFYGENGGALVFWNEGAGSRQVQVQLPGTDHTSHDSVSGSANQIQAEIVIKAEKIPVFITWQDVDTSSRRQAVSGDESR